MDNGSNKRLKIEKKENGTTERSPPLPLSVIIFILNHLYSFYLFLLSGLVVLVLFLKHVLVQIRNYKNMNVVIFCL